MRDLVRRCHDAACDRPGLEGILDVGHVQCHGQGRGFASAAAHAHGLSRCLNADGVASHQAQGAEIKRPWTRLLIVNDALLLSTNPSADEDEEPRAIPARLARAFSENLVMDEAHHVEETWRKNEADGEQRHLCRHPHHLYALTDA